ncbi:competence/damage-inducible protein A [Paramaledivibacter caminithermalis]|uniref:Putative competence-damage inducible protein n=1 Tax=Paramaledivibacter caminithermalis (strain DSM 15212 / CIP 107654 / DViRD3) TaxID=1121301 RepID=A0A1M6N4F4_PARC5|nr:competence/damage-inducible protein A [Paramaledivibacter caminithermalis]SHJ90574.1 nicotinamide-nucleotide amidase [Paramaledivibacter caminithermalis DSM 15212]
MNCTILTVGTELLMGQIVNTNAAFLSKELNELGINVLYHLTVGDNPDRLEKIFKDALEFSDLIITTGGLGPTQDDLTKETISNALDRELILHKPTYNKIKDFFISINREMTINNKKQAYIPHDSIVLDNEKGTAPGFIIEADEKIIISLPGPPKEMKSLFLNLVKPYLLSKSEFKIKSKIIKFFDIGESSLETALEDIITNQTNPTLATYAKDGELSLRITAKGETDEEIDGFINPIMNEVKKRLGKKIYSYNNETLEEVVAKMLIDNNITISLAESCTGGLLASKLTAISGISKALDRAIVTYSNTAKIQELNVDEIILKEHGAVSEETAAAMAQGLKTITKSDICLSITGIAGPTGGTLEKPVGLVYIGIATDKKTFIKKLSLKGDRNKIRNYTAISALNLIRKTIEMEFIN